MVRQLLEGRVAGRSGQFSVLECAERTRREGFFHGPRPTALVAGPGDGVARRPAVAVVVRHAGVDAERVASSLAPAPADADEDEACEEERGAEDRADYYPRDGAAREDVRLGRGVGE